MRPFHDLPLLVTLLGLTACATPTAPTRPLSDLELATPAGVVTRSSAVDATLPPAEQKGWRITLSGLMGYRKLDEDSWRQRAGPGVTVEQDDQFVLGVEADFHPRDFPLGIEVGFSDSFAGDTETINGRDVSVTSNLFEFYFGPRLTLDLADDSVHPYVGAGLSTLFANVDRFEEIGDDTYVVSSRDETSLAGYAHVGVLFDVAKAFHIGVDGRGVFWSDIDDGNDADYFQVMLLAGTHW